jgi:hypothetical protein
MEPDSLHTPDVKTAGIPQVDMPLDAEIDTASLKHLCELLEQDGRIVCLRDAGGDSANLARLRDRLPGFVAFLDPGDDSNLSAIVAKSLSLGTEQTDESILESRWKVFSEVVQRYDMPLTVVVSAAEKLSGPRLAQIRDFLQPISGRLILASRGDAPPLLEVADVVKQQPADVVKQQAADVLKQQAADALKKQAADVLKKQAADVFKQQVAEIVKEKVPPARPPLPLPVRVAAAASIPRPAAATPSASIASIAAKPQPTIRVVPAPASKSPARPESDPSPVPEREPRRRHPLALLALGSGIGITLGFLVAAMPDLDVLSAIRLASHDSSDEPLPRQVAQPASGNAAVNADKSETDGSRPPGDARQDETLDVAPADAGDVDADNPPQPQAPLADAPAARGAADPAMDIAALETPPAAPRDAAVPAEPEPAPGDAGERDALPPAASPADGSATAAPPNPAPPAATQAPAVAKVQVLPAAHERARLAMVHLRRAEREWEAGNLQQSLLEVARGLDADPGNAQLQALREKVLAGMDMRRR